MSFFCSISPVPVLRLRSGGVCVLNQARTSCWNAKSSGLKSMSIVGLYALAACASDRDAAAADQRLAADVVRFGNTQQVDRSGRFLGCAATTQRNGALHHFQQIGVDADLDLLALDVNGCVAAGRSFGQPRFDHAKSDGVDVHLVTPPLLGERLGQANDAGLAR